MLFAGNGQFFETDLLQISKRLGYSQRKPSPAVTTATEDAVRYARRLLKPRYIYTIKNIESISGGEVRLEGPVILHSQVLSGLLTGCDKAALFAVTIGGLVERTSGTFARKGAMLKSYLFDTVGSECVEIAARRIHQRMRRHAQSHGMLTTRRLSPGHCDWDITEQRTMFEVLKPQMIGMQLTSSCSMRPKKSITGIIGIGPADKVGKFNPCLTCTEKSCPGRR